MRGNPAPVDMRRAGHNAGLSPRVRGNRPLPGCSRSRRRSIPACAGEPSRVMPGSSPPGVYPRVCGGTVDGTEGVHTQDQVYPRVCGGTQPEDHAGGCPYGLSPRVRGNPTQPGCAGAPMTRRSIPACAGEPRPYGYIRNSAEVYPRVCGGTIERIFPTTSKRGLSPRVRGNLLACLCKAAALGSIPACAGEPPSSAPRPTAVWVYPRVCGGTGFKLATGWKYRGLSPRVRGNQPLGYHCPVTPGSIPACAGEPMHRRIKIKLKKVYPRVCGGTQAKDPSPALAYGLSPRVRGNLVQASEYL